MKSRTSRGVCLSVVLAPVLVSLWSVVPAGAQNCSAPHPAAPAIDSLYNPGTGWFEMRNWVDSVPEGSVRKMRDGGVGQYPVGNAKYPLYFPNAGGDWFACALRSGTENPQGQIPGQRNQPLLLADPTVMRLDSAYGTWYYMTGTCGAPNIKTRYRGNLPLQDSNADELAVLGTQLANFIIYRTKDFFHWEAHMGAFDEAQDHP